jgi:hypothetical protein
MASFACLYHQPEAAQYEAAVAASQSDIEMTQSFCFAFKKKGGAWLWIQVANHPKRQKLAAIYFQFTCWWIAISLLMTLW